MLLGTRCRTYQLWLVATTLIYSHGLLRKWQKILEQKIDINGKLVKSE